MDVEARIAELERRLDESFVRGKICDVDPGAWRVRVAYGTDDAPQKTAWLPVKPIRSGKAIVWWFPEVDEGVTVLSPGDLRLGEVWPGSYYSDRPPPTTNPDEFHVEFGDGSYIIQNRARKSLTIVNAGDVMFHAKGEALIKSDGNMKLEAPRIDFN